MKTLPFFQYFTRAGWALLKERVMNSVKGMYTIRMWVLPTPPLCHYIFRQRRYCFRPQSSSRAPTCTCMPKTPCSRLLLYINYSPDALRGTLQSGRIE